MRDVYHSPTVQRAAAISVHAVVCTNVEEGRIHLFGVRDLLFRHSTHSFYREYAQMLYPGVVACKSNNSKYCECPHRPFHGLFSEEPLAITYKLLKWIKKYRSSIVKIYGERGSSSSARFAFLERGTNTTAEILISKSCTTYVLLCGWLLDTPKIGQKLKEV